jgi:hypothetical protein
MATKSKIQTFSRYEFKYLLDKKVSESIAIESEKFMDYDGYTHPTLGNMYFVRSLYFDNFLSSNFFEKVDGMRIRRKFRLRTYSDEFNKNIPIFLEEKGRNNQRTFKERVLINHNHYELFLDSNKSFDLLNLYPGNDLIERFVFNINRKRLTPKVLVDYNRKPLVNKHGLAFRLTFDSHINSLRTNSLFDRSGGYKCKAGYTILEVKFDRSIPPWFHRIIQNYDMQRLSVSKFVLGMEVCNIAHDVS